MGKITYRTPKLFTAKVMHKRLFPKVNMFTYSVYYLLLPLSALKQGVVNAIMPVNRAGAISFHECDHGDRNGSIDTWIHTILSNYHLDTLITEIELVTMPRVLGYIFNPVSFWLCLDKDGQLIAMLSEVNNTFGETHSYLAYHKNKRPIAQNDWLEAEKLFHVSPFLQREGTYTFRVAYEEDRLGIWIDFYNEEGKKQLLTSLVGQCKPLTKKALVATWVTHPLVTLKTITLIHWQAIKLVAKGIAYIPKPLQRKERLSVSSNLKKM